MAENNVCLELKWNFTMEKFERGQLVKFGDAKNPKSGEVQARFIHNTEMEIDGRVIKHVATSKNPAYLIKIKDNDHVMKSESDLRSF